MVTPLVDVFGEIGAQIVTIAVVALSVAVVPLGAWAFTRLTMKIVNRGVGK